MMHSLPYLIVLLIVGIGLIVVLTTRYKVPAFFALFLTCLVVGLGANMPLDETVTVIKDGFGNILKSLGLIIVLGSTLGLVLEHTGSTTVMATFLLQKMGNRFAPLAMSITGFIVGLPIFCDSGYIVLSGLNHSMAKRAGVPISIMSVSLATGLYSVHCLIPPHPGSAAAAATLGADFGKLLLIGIPVAIPSMIVGNLWAIYSGKQSASFTEEIIVNSVKVKPTHQPSLLVACLPVFIPILLIGIRPFLSTKLLTSYSWLKMFSYVGNPIIALLLGIVLAFMAKRNWLKNELAELLHKATEKAGEILVIIGMGGAFGAILTTTKIGEHVSQSIELDSIGLLFPFILTAVLKTAQGSSTVAIITAASIVLPLLPALHLNNETGRLVCVLAMGSGSMMISHANDAYFWVIAKFSGLDMRTMLRSYSVATILMSITTFLTVYLLSKVL
ncbi:GntP family permease [Xanthocytophaga agilis]|uniref:GntP family permease n=1 Tax=Xanthocytophaga agilis TaxID=3048010 RepID=A0AAE3UEE5_9BACT|nr:GntP family permease [Xanthocytophaga agilis]MDJ1502708.1 GntP family permease [Xanthocytophaga agilis]